MPKNRPKIFTIAGFDPSSGAGITADIKTAESLRCYAMGICTAITVQNETHFNTTYWLPQHQIHEQLDILFSSHTPQVIKIGIIENFSLLSTIIKKIIHHYPKVPIIWDPVLSSSTGYSFHHPPTLQNIEEILKHILLITPNIEEFQKLFPSLPLEEKKIQQWIRQNQYANILIKGGHREGKKKEDILITPSAIFHFQGKKFADTFQKHGSGCVLSSAIACYLAYQYPLEKACKKAKQYIHHFLTSTPGLLGYHHT